jgi:glutamate synthase (NADPH/NADH) small chain
MNEILEKVSLAPEVTKYIVSAPKIARKRRAGQFVLVRLHEGGERIPLTIADADADRGTITLVVQEVGKTTAEMNLMRTGQRLANVVGPLGLPTHVERIGTVVCVGGGIGIAPLHPVAQAMKAEGNRVIIILGARSQDLLIMEEEMARISDELRICTDDGSKGSKGFVSQVLQQLIDSGEPIDQVIAIGPAIMMKVVSEVTRPHEIKTMVSLNSVMVDGTGMCGGCRVEIDGEPRFACVDGPDFDGHAVNFDLLMRRQAMYREQEKQTGHGSLHGRSRVRAGDGAMTGQTEKRKLTPKERMKIPRHAMREQPPAERRRNFTEVPYGYSPEEAVAEAERCLACSKSTCIDGCPVAINIPKFIGEIAEGDFRAAARTMRESNLLPSICGRVCPQEDQCEIECVVGKKGEAVAIGRLERFIGDWERDTGNVAIPVRAAPTGQRAGGRRRLRPRWAHLRCRPHTPGTRGRGLRGLPPTGRGPSLRHPRVPSAQRHHRGRAFAA